MQFSLEDTRLLLVSIAQEAADGLIANWNDANWMSVSVEKGVNNVALVADIRTQRFIAERLRKAHPEIPFSGEEDGRWTPLTFGLRWIVDPIDGTSRYLKHEWGFGTMICLVDGPVVLAGAIYVPRYQQSSGIFTPMMFSFAQGNPVVLNSQPLDLASFAAPKSGRLAGGIPDRETAPAFDERNAIRLALAAADLVDVRRDTTAATEARGGPIAWNHLVGSAAANTARLLLGETDFYGNMGTGEIYDLILPAAFVEAAGGTVVRIDGTRPEWNRRFEPIILARRKDFADRLLQAVPPEASQALLQALP